MHTIKNVSKSRHQVRTLDQGLVFMDPGDSLNADLERTYAALMRRSMSLSVAEAAEGATPGLSRAEPTEDDEKSTEQPQNGSSDVETPPVQPTTRAEWALFAESKGIVVKGNWGINRIKTELEQLP